MTYQEENNYPKAIAIATVVMGLLIALSFLWVIGSFQPEEEPGMGGIVVNFGTSATGIGNDYTSIEEPSMDPNANGKMPDKVTPEQKVTPNSSSAVNAKEILTQTNEDAVAVNTKVVKSNNAPTNATTDKPSTPTVNPNALYKGKKNNGTGAGDGTGGEPGNQGDVNGDPLASNYGEGGSGNGNTPIPINKFINLVKPTDNSQERGKVAIRVYFNRAGRITNAKVDLKGSTTTNPELQRKCLQSVLNSSLMPTEKGSDNKQGVVIFNFGVN